MPRIGLWHSSQWPINDPKKESKCRYLLKQKLCKNEGGKVVNMAYATLIMLLCCNHVQCLRDSIYVSHCKFPMEQHVAQYFQRKRCVVDAERE